jgi:hypothetical protein
VRYEKLKVRGESFKKAERIEFKKKGGIVGRCD